MAGAGPCRGEASCQSERWSKEKAPGWDLNPGACQGLSSQTLWPCLWAEAGGPASRLHGLQLGPFPRVDQMLCTRKQIPKLTSDAQIGSGSAP